MTTTTLANHITAHLEAGRTTFAMHRMAAATGLSEIEICKQIAAWGRSGEFYSACKSGSRNGCSHWLWQGKLYPR